MRKDRHIRNWFSRDWFMQRGYRWATVIPRGDRKGLIRSAHRTYEAARKAAAGKDLEIVEIAMGGSY